MKLVARQVSGLDKDGLRALVDQHRGQIKSGVVVLASPSEGKVSIVVGVTPDLTKRAPAGQIVKQLAPIVGGGGGGRPDFAEAGRKGPSKISSNSSPASRGVIEETLLIVWRALRRISPHVDSTAVYADRHQENRRLSQWNSSQPSA